MSDTRRTEPAPRDLPQKRAARIMHPPTPRPCELSRERRYCADRMPEDDCNLLPGAMLRAWSELSNADAAKALRIFHHTEPLDPEYNCISPENCQRWGLDCAIDYLEARGFFAASHALETWAVTVLGYPDRASYDGDLMT